MNIIEIIESNTQLHLLQSSSRFLGIAQFNKIFNAQIKPNDEHKRAQREEAAWSRWEQGLLWLI